MKFFTNFEIISTKRDYEVYGLFRPFVVERLVNQTRTLKLFRTNITKPMIHATKIYTYHCVM